jgi:hypothetical protein
MDKPGEALDIRLKGISGIFHIDGGRDAIKAVAA